MNTTERAAAIRAALKARGINSRQVSVKASYFSLGSAIDVRIKDARVAKSIVEDIANEHEAIRRCEITGDILGGGNRYVSVNYTHDVATQVARTWHDAVQAARDQATDNYLIPVEGAAFMVGVGRHGVGVSVWRTQAAGGGYVTDAYDVNGAAEIIGLSMIAQAAA